MRNRDIAIVINALLMAFLVYNHFTKPYISERWYLIILLGITLSIQLMGWDKEVKDV